MYQGIPTFKIWVENDESLKRQRMRQGSGEQGRGREGKESSR